MEKHLVEMAGIDLNQKGNKWLLLITKSAEKRI